MWSYDTEEGGGVGHILVSSYVRAIGKILKSTYAEHNIWSYDGRAGRVVEGGVQNCLGY